MHDGHDHDHEGESAHHGEGDEIVLPPEDAARFGVEAEAVKAGSFHDVVKTSGQVLPAATDQSVASAPTGGLLRLAPGISVGSTVSAGQVIGRITASDVTGGDANAAAKAALDAAKRELDRVTPLLSDGLITRKEYNEALAAYESAKAAYSPAAASGVVKAVKGGVISSIPVADGQIVSPGETVAVIGSAGSLTLRALLPTADASFLPSVKGAIIGLPDGRSIDISEIGGKLTSKSPAGAAATPGYIPVYFTFDATGAIAPGSAAEVWLLGGSADKALTVAREAVAEQMGQHFVYVKVDDHGYRKTPVTLGRGDGLRYEIVSGLAEGDSVVSRGMTFVRLAETKGAVPEGHSHSH